MQHLFNLGKLNIFSSDYQPLDERMYTLISGGEALVVDPNVDEEQIDYLRQHGIEELMVVLTHCHYDHISGLNRLREAFRCTVIGTRLCLENLENPRKNLSKYANLVFATHGFSKDEAPEILPFSCHGDIGFDQEYVFEFAGRSVVLKAVPGHSADSLMMLMDGAVFTGDNLIPETPTALTLPGSSREAYENITKPYIRSLKSDTFVFPAHKDADTLENILKNHPDYVLQKE